MNKILFICAIYFIFINIISSIITLNDKIKAKKGKWRVSEKTLFILAFLGGAVFEYLTMLAIRHKTKHKAFMLGLPAIIFFQFIILIIIFFKVAV